MTELPKIKRLPKLSELGIEREREEEEERIETSGVGALGGMITGVILGLPFGPLGVIVGGILGAVVGNQIEYEDKRRKR